MIRGISHVAAITFMRDGRQGRERKRSACEKSIFHFDFLKAEDAQKRPKIQGIKLSFENVGRPMRRRAWPERRARKYGKHRVPRQRSGKDEDGLDKFRRGRF